jgi:chemotaxis protein methyltransferase CheR
MSVTQSAAAPREREFEFTEKEFRFLADLVYARVGITLGENKKDMVYGRLVRRLRKLNIATFAGYCQFLQSAEGEVEMGELINAVTTNLTSFFREGHHFEHLAEELARMKPKRLRIWSAGCSAGMEPYSIAMVVAKYAEEARQAPCDYKILATDIDTNMLATAEAMVYPAEQYEKIPEVYRRYAAKEGREMQVDPVLSANLTFNRLNLLESWPMKGPFDFIFCRNVAIYFDKDTQRNLFNRMADLLVPEGWLYIGHSENLFNVTDRFKSCGKTIYRRVK